MEQLPIKIRASNKGDEPIILGSWKSSILGSATYRWLPRDVYYRGEGKVVTQMLRRYGAVVACNPIFDDQVFGWLVHGGEAIHYVYVKQRFRRQQVASRLIELAFGSARDFVCTAWTDVCERLSPAWTLRYRPSLLGKERSYETNKVAASQADGACEVVRIDRGAPQDGTGVHPAIGR